LQFVFAHFLGEISEILWLAVQLFHETFDESFEGSWVVSGKEEYAGNQPSRLVSIARSACLVRSVTDPPWVGGFSLAGAWVSDLATRASSGLRGSESDMLRLERDVQRQLS
jgi:hypothetical protein